MTRTISSTTFLCVLGLISWSSCGVWAGPRYIAIPIDNVDVIELNPSGPRYPRHSDSYVMPAALSPLQQHQEPEQPRPERATAHLLDYVDFGAHTGPNGAFSWYADYPSHH